MTYTVAVRITDERQRITEYILADDAVLTVEQATDPYPSPPSLPMVTLHGSVSQLIAHRSMSKWRRLWVAIKGIVQ
jgi:hypothetical protein